MKSTSRPKAFLSAATVTILSLVALAGVRPLSELDEVAPGLQAPDAYTLQGPRSFYDGYPATNEDGTINVVVEIPAGSTEKWEVGEDGVLRWEFKNDEPRVVKYLGYPGSYGMIPRTLMAKELGGDGDPLDVLVLGQSIPRGTVARAHLLGVLHILDGGEQDDKLVAVRDGSPLAEARNLAELNEKYPGVSTIVETWFSSYKGAGVMESQGWADVGEARRVLEASSAAFEKRSSGAVEDH